MMQKRITRALAYLLAMCLLFSSFPAMASAADNADQAGNTALAQTINSYGGSGSAQVNTETGHVELLKDVELAGSNHWT